MIEELPDGGFRCNLATCGWETSSRSAAAGRFHAQDMHNERSCKIVRFDKRQPKGDEAKREKQRLQKRAQRVREAEFYELGRQSWLWKLTTRCGRPFVMRAGPDPAPRVLG